MLGVGQGSQQSPRFLKMTYTPSRATGAPLALVGKGVTFDSGGLSLKPADGMETMKTDMAGARRGHRGDARARQAGRAPQRQRRASPLAENMPSGHRASPGDVLTIRNGKTVEVLNTDAEGRLILADALSLACEDGADAIVDLATLTGAAMVALGDEDRRRSWPTTTRGATRCRPPPTARASRCGRCRCRRSTASSSSRRSPTSRTSAALATAAHSPRASSCSEFVTPDMPWAHLDIAGPARANGDDGYLVKGGTGFGVRTLVELVTAFDAPAKKTVASHREEDCRGRRRYAKKAAAKKAPARKTTARKRAR